MVYFRSQSTLNVIIIQQSRHLWPKTQTSLSDCFLFGECAHHLPYCLLIELRRGGSMGRDHAYFFKKLFLAVCCSPLETNRLSGTVGTNSVSDSGK